MESQSIISNNQMTQKSSKTGVTSSGKLPIILGLNRYPTIKEILVIGCGGTGAYLVSHLSRLLSVVKNNIKLYLADGDIVEEKNLIRQHFIHQDIGRNKAEVIGERYSSAFGIQIGVIPKYLENSDDLKLFQASAGTFIIVGCVDNNASRKVIREWFLDYNNDAFDYRNYMSKFWIDCGNEERNGQIVCGYAPSSRAPYSKVNPSKVTKSINGEFSLPCVTEIYPNLMEGDIFNSQVSCAENIESAPQNMQTNITAATIAMNFLNKIILKETIKSHCVEFSINNSFTTKLNTPENLSFVDTYRRKPWERK